MKRPPGRPVGSVAIVAAAKVALSRCPRCGSTARTRYRDRVRLALKGQLPDGSPYNSVTRHRTTCADCGEPRHDLLYQYRPAKP